MNPIVWEGNAVRILDQRKLPLLEEWVVVRNAPEMAEAIRRMVLRGAPLIGIAAAYGLALEAAASENLTNLQESANLLKATRPTAINLSWAVNRVIRTAKEALNEREPLAARVLREALAIHEEDRALCKQIARHGADLLQAGGVLTHCNTGSLATGGMGTAYGIIKEGFALGKVSHVFACESRPFLQGARLTAYELKEDGIPFTLITDSMAGHFLRLGKIQAVVVGADRVAANGDVANKIGTYSLAVLARENEVPFYVAAPSSSFDASLPTGEGIPVEERDPEEVTEIMGVRIAPQGTKAANPAFDITPNSFITAIITEKGIVHDRRTGVKVGSAKRGH